MPRWLKRGMDASAIKAADAKVRETVEGILAQVEERGDAAIRDLSQKFDNWSPPSFKLTPQEIEHAISQVAKRDLDDIQFAQAQVRNFAQKQQRHDAATSRSRRCPASCSATGTSRSTRSAATCRAGAIRWSPPRTCRSSPRGSPACKRIIACAPPFKGGPHPAIVAAMHFGGADEIYVLGGVQAVAAMALGTETISPVDMIVGPGNAYVAEAKRQLFGRVGIDLLAGPTETLIIADDTRRRRDLRHRPARPGRARADLARRAASPIRRSSRATPWRRSSGC